jgi:hypothetical protein
MVKTSASTHAACPGQTGSVQRKQGGSVKGASTQTTALADSPIKVATRLPS